MVPQPWVRAGQGRVSHQNSQCLSKTLDLEAVLRVPLSQHAHFWKVVYGVSQWRKPPEMKPLSQGKATTRRKGKNLIAALLPCLSVFIGTSSLHSHAEDVCAAIGDHRGTEVVCMRMPHMLGCLNTWSPVSNTVWEWLGSAGLLKCITGGGL